jgi:hypothetical protein
MNAPKTLTWAAVVLLSIGTTGCIPGITWLPDSSGFIYEAGNEGHNLVHFDLAKKTQRTIVSDAKLQTAWPAVSPDGKSLAAARLTLDQDKGDSIQLLIYDLNGKSKKQSKVFLLPRADNRGNRLGQESTWLFWGPREDKILVSISTSPPRVGIYEIKTDELKVLKDAFAAAIAGRPARPDGKGFVVTKWRDHDCAGISLVDWDGNEKPIAMKPQVADNGYKKDMLTWPYMFTSSWQGAKALLSSSKGRLEIDTDKLVARFDSFGSEEPNDENSVRQQFTFLDSQNILRIVDWTKHTNRGDDHMSRLEMLDARQKRTQTLIDNEQFKALFPSPDGKLVAVRCVGQPSDSQDKIWVIDQEGQVVAKVNVQE